MRIDTKLRHGWISLKRNFKLLSIEPSNAYSHRIKWKNESLSILHQHVRYTLPHVHVLNHTEAAARE